ncbi:putative pumilio homolog 19 [Eutrema salsugineum]|uniref:putative pumilio homolog 19 n=1 Tax=Eutrema salsugineum TaxID=72664 RepID=UPI000CECF523|nr:putative pumilio homolog 19 [Eutrema salsugineum]XP_024012521.1 putative pumilio homolog 19 [Eutrema salsugineum]
MAISDNTFSMSTMYDALPNIRSSNTRLNPLFNLMITDNLTRAHFKEVISSRLNQRQLLSMASLLTSDSDAFMEVVRNKIGSTRVQMLLGMSDDVDAFFYTAILRRFLHIMTDKYASRVAIRAMSVFDQEKRYVMYEHTLYHALDLACEQHGCIALNEVITDADDPCYRNLLLDLVARNALFLSNDASGNFVVQHVLQLRNLRCTHNVAVSLRGHCVDLSFRRYGSYIVEKLLQERETMVVVVMEFLECEGGRLMRLARNEFGNFVVFKALRLTKDMNRADLFWDLAQKLMPFLHLLRRSHGNNIANILESCSITTRFSS